MIVCSCAVVTDRDIAEAITVLYDADPYAVVTPGRIMHALGRRFVCFGCRLLFVSKIEREIQRRAASSPHPTPKGKEGML